jgi:tRNA pseudouridine65 synthase
MISTQSLTIAYQDEHLVAIDKPAGLLVHRSRIAAEAREFAMQKLRDQIGQPVFPVHRLDRPTSGVLLFGLNPEMAKRLAQQFESRSVEKQYVALVRGTPNPFGVWDEPLMEKPDRIVDRLADEIKPPQPAITKFETVRSWEVPFSTGKYPHSRYSLVRVQPMTGRRHQIRRHFNHMGHPIVGDTSHGDRRHNRLFREQFNSFRLMLVAVSLTISHPVSDSELKIEANWGVDFQQTLDHLDASKIDDPNSPLGSKLATDTEVI